MPLAAKLIILFGLALLVCWVLVQHFARLSEAEAEASHPPEGQVLDIGGVQVHAVVMGEGPDLVLLHGSSGNTRDMTHSLAPKLAQRYRVIVFDRPGLGYTDQIDHSGATIVQQAQLLSEAAQHLGAKHPIVLGHSYGGAVALAWAVHHPDRLSGLLAVSAASHPWDTGLSTYYKVLSHPVWGPLAIPLITAFVPDARVSQELSAVFAPDMVPEGYMAHFGPGLTLRRVSLRANAMQRANLLEEITALSPRYPEITVPTEILHGTADDLVGLDIHSRPLTRAIPDAYLTTLEGIGHMPHHSAQAQIIAAIDRVATRAGLRP